MRLIPRISRFESEKNGSITVKEFLGRKILFAGGFEQSGPYVTGLWSDALKKMSHHPSSVLIVGLGLGDNVHIVQKQFPQADITVIEWDPVIIKIAQEAKRFDIDNVRIIEGDLRDVLPTLPHSYDLILSDAFFGDKPDVGMDTQAGESFNKILNQDGMLLLNSSRTPEAIEHLSHFLKLQHTWKFRDNTVAMFGK
jgi:spermidine synthase